MRVLGRQGKTKHSAPVALEEDEMGLIRSRVEMMHRSRSRLIIKIGTSITCNFIYQSF